MDKNKFIIIGGMAVALYVLIVNAWICDDAYITLRTVDNFISGYGLTWNPGERVQSYSHPLWMLLLSFFYLITSNSYFMPVFLSVIISIISLWLLVKYLSGGLINSIIVLLLALLSKSFIDYSTSGLENPLSYLIIITFYLVYLKKEIRNRLLVLVLLASCSALNRYDLTLLTFPPLFYESINTCCKRFRQISIGLLPIVLWIFFSLLYYGFAVPNTAFAKLNAGIPQSDYFTRGLSYFSNSIQYDPITLTLILIALVYSFYKVFYLKENKYIAPAVSIILYNLYILYIGGDFMSGRFFSVIYLLSLIILSQIDFVRDHRKFIYYRMIPLIPILIMGLLNPLCPVYSRADYGDRENLQPGLHGIPFSDENLITDERAYYYQYNGLLPVLLNGRTDPDNDYREMGIKSRQNAPLVINAHAVGIFSFYAGPENYIIDEYSLSDAFLSKLPQEYRPGWRIGHIQRVIPEGYIQSLIEKKNLLVDPNLKEYYGYIKKIINGEIFDTDRLMTIINMNLGNYNYLLDKDYSVNDYPVLTSGDSTTLSYYYNDLSLYHFYSKNDVENALFFALKSISYNKNYDYIYYNTAMYYWKGMNDINKAIAFIKKAIKLNDRLTEAYKALAEIYNEAGNTDSANHYLNIYYKLDLSDNGK